MNRLTLEVRIRRERRRGLQRFKDAQDEVWPDVIRELKAGRKQTHWMWFVFPQRVGLGKSAMSRIYGLTRREAIAYRDDPVLWPRLVECCELVLAHYKPLEQIFGPLDAMKFRSCVELFATLDTYAEAVRRDVIRAERYLRWTEDA